MKLPPYRDYPGLAESIATLCVGAWLVVAAVLHLPVRVWKAVTKEKTP